VPSKAGTKLRLRDDIKTNRSLGFTQEFNPKKKKKPSEPTLIPIEK
jgi:hypothetical protein